MNGSFAWASAWRSDLLNLLTDGARDGVPRFLFGRRHNCLRPCFCLYLQLNCVLTPENASAYN